METDNKPEQSDPVISHLEGELKKYKSKLTEADRLLAEEQRRLKLFEQNYVNVKACVDVTEHLLTNYIKTLNTQNSKGVEDIIPLKAGLTAVSLGQMQEQSLGKQLLAAEQEATLTDTIDSAQTEVHPEPRPEPVVEDEGVGYPKGHPLHNSKSIPVKPLPPRAARELNVGAIDPGNPDSFSNQAQKNLLG